MPNREDSQRGPEGSLVGTLTGILVILGAAAAGLLALLGLEVSLAYMAAIESLVVALAGLGYLLVRLSRHGSLYRHVSELSSTDRRLSLLLVLPTLASAVFCVMSGANLDLLVTLEAGLAVMVLVLVSIAMAGRGGG